MSVTKSTGPRTQLGQASGLDAVVTGVNGSLQAIEHPENAIPSSQGPSQSVFPDAVDLNAPAAVSPALFLAQTARTALEIANQPRPIESISTADFISHTSFKKDSKCIIRIVPSGSLGKVRDASGVERAVKDAALFFDKFSLQSTVEDDSERFQIFEGMEGETLFLFGRKPRIWTFPGIVLNGTRPTIPTSLNAPGQESLKKRYIERLNMDFADELMRKYEQFYRGTQALKLRMRCYISYENVIVECTLLSMTAARNNMVGGAVPVNLTVLVHERSWMGDGLTLTEDETLTALLAVQEHREFLQNGVPPASIIQAPVSLDQLSARSKTEAADVLAAQETVSGLEAQADAANAAAIEAQTRLDTATTDLEERVQKEAEIQAGIDAGDPDFTEDQLESVRQDQSDLAEAASQAAAAVDESKAILSARLAEIDEAQQVADAAVSAQASTQASLEKHPSGDGSSSLTIHDYTAELSTEGDRKIFRVFKNTEDGEVLSEQDVTGTPLGESPDFIERGRKAELSAVIA